jgi:hypothetical protein
VIGLYIRTRSRIPYSAYSSLYSFSSKPIIFFLNRPRLVSLLIFRSSSFQINGPLFVIKFSAIFVFILGCRIWCWFLVLCVCISLLHINNCEKHGGSFPFWYLCMNIAALYVKISGSRNIFKCLNSFCVESRLLILPIILIMIFWILNRGHKVLAAVEPQSKFPYIKYGYAKEKYNWISVFLF